MILQLIKGCDFIQQLADIGRAVEFCKEHDDEELWTALIDYSIDKVYSFMTFFVIFGIFIYRVAINKLLWTDSNPEIPCSSPTS